MADYAALIRPTSTFVRIEPRARSPRHNAGRAPWPCARIPGIFHLSDFRPALIAAVVASLSSAPALALGDGPAIASDWADLTVPQAECFAPSQAAIQRIGFGEVERTKYSRFGTREDYTVSVRCIEEKGLVLFLASGRERVNANALQLNLQRNYLKGN